MNPELQNVLNRAGQDQLRELIESIYGMNNEVDRRIEVLLMRAHPEALGGLLKKRIQSIARGKRFIDYRQCAEFSRTLDTLIDDIALLIDSAPKLAFELADRLIATHEPVYERSDDSYGDIGGSYAHGLEVWLTAASRWRKTGDCRLDWLAELFSRHNNNGYAVWDNLVANCGALLTSEELKQLVWRFETEFKQVQAEPADRGYNFGVARASLGMAAVAEALSDVPLFERSILLTSPEPNELQKQSIVKFCLRHNDGESALKWLAQPWGEHYSSERLTLLDQTYAALGRDRELLELRRGAYQQHPDHQRLKALLNALPKEERAAMQSQAIANALTLTDIESRIETLLALNATKEAKEQLFTHYAQLNVFYGSLLNWAAAFSQAEQFLASAVCYRLLLEDILASARSKAYHHAADYYRQLVKLDARIERYDPLTDWQGYQQQLRQQHGRKSSFWQWVS